MNTFLKIITPFFFLAFLLVNSTCKEPATETKAVMGTITESVYASLSIEPEDLYSVYAVNSGIIQSLFIKEGDTVQKNQVLAMISADNQKLNLDNASLNLEKSRENYQGQESLLGNIKNEMESMQKKLQLDSLNYFRQKLLWEQNIGSKTDLENKKLKYENAVDNLHLLKQKYRQASLDLKNSFLQSRNILKKEKLVLNDYTVRSKMNGIVYSLFKNEGERVNQQDIFAKIGNANDFIIKLQIDEVDVTKVIPGQKIIISLDAYKKQVFTARITKVNPQKDIRNQSFEVEGVFIDAPPTLYSGLTGEGNIIINQRKDAMIIPLNFLMPGNKVKTKSGDIIVGTGLRNIDFIEITSGLDTNTILIKP